MGLNNIEKVLSQTLTELENEGRLKGKEYIITKVKKAQGEKGPRYFLKGNNVSAIASSWAAELYGLKVLSSGIQDNKCLVLQCFSKGINQGNIAGTGIQTVS